MKPRINADFNQSTKDGWCWTIYYKEKPITGHGSDFVPTENMEVILYSEDDSEPFEYDGVLSFRPQILGAPSQWMGKPDLSTYRTFTVD